VCPVPARETKTFEYAISLDRAGRPAAEGGEPLELPEGWAAEHLVLAGLARCTLTSLRYHAIRAGLDAVGSASARGTVTKRDDDGRYAFVEVECELDVEIAPEPDDLGALLAKAERDCFVGASLTVEVRYRWRVNGSDAQGVRPEPRRHKVDR
jgi:uncharacterized OsmC-like protein